MNAKNQLINYKFVDKLIFYNKRNQKMLVIDGKINIDELTAVVLLKPCMKLYGSVKLVCFSRKDSRKEYQVIGMDKDADTEVESNGMRRYIIYLSKKIIVE